MAKTEKELLESILKETQYQRRITFFIGIVTIILTLYLIVYSITSILISCKSIGNPSCYSPYLEGHSISFGTADLIFIVLLAIEFVILRKDFSKAYRNAWIVILILAIIVLIGALI